MFSIVFPGQGAQKVGMGMDFSAAHPVAREVFQEADQAFGGPLSKWIAEGPDETLRRTEITQPAILTASIAAYRVLERQLPVAPTLLAGHSLGEYTALVAGGGLSFSEAVALVRRRGAFMQEAVPEGQGAMAAIIGLDGFSIARVCAETPGRVAPANFNTPEQTVIAGEAPAVEEAREALLAAGAKRALMLDVSAPFHCEMMAPAMDRLGEVLAETRFQDVKVPVVSNVSARPYQTAEEARTLLKEQVCAPVRWLDGVRCQIEAGVALQIEVGPGSALTGMAAKIDRRLARSRVTTLEDLEPALAKVAEVSQ
jgi:[acyl-carrier-protein] S-malonyltransferase